MNNCMITCTELFEVIGFTIGMTLLAVLFVWMWWNGYLHISLKEDIEDIKEGWPFYILLLVFGFILPVTWSLVLNFG